MAIGQKPREPARTDPVGPPRPGAEREIEVSRAVEGGPADAVSKARAGAAALHATHDPSGASRVYDRPGRGTHIVLYVGALLMTVIPFLMLAALSRAGERQEILARGPGRAPFALALHGITSLCGVLLVGRRLRRSISPLRRTAYIAGAWLLCLGLGFAISRLDVATGDFVFDAGTLALFALLLPDRVMRRRARGET